MKFFAIACACLATFSLAWAQPQCKCPAGWEQAGNVRNYEPDNLFDYMDGNAEGYLVYNFVGMTGVTCKKDDTTVLIDVFEMADPEYAYGIFTANRDPREPIEKIGMGGQVLSRRATFAKGKYYIEIAANPAGDHKATLTTFMDTINKSFAGQTERPDILNWFPQDGLVADSARLVPVSVLGLPFLETGYIAKYDIGRAFIVREASVEAAKQVMAKFKQRVGENSPVPVADEGFTATDRYLDGLCVFRKGQYVGGVANLKGGQDGLPLAKQLAAALK